MSKFGLTRELIATQPWSIPRELLLASKTNTDPVHGDIYLTELERRIIDTSPLQRLRRVLQLGTTQLVYPGATHTRFSHALGALKTAQILLDAIFERPETRHHESTILDDWEERGTLHEDKAKAIVLGRLGALLHDICHIPFGHTLEDDLGLLPAHDDDSGGRFDVLWKAIVEESQIDFSPDLLDELRPMILKGDPGRTSDFRFVEDLVGNTICADLIDYLHRDFHYTGLRAGLGTRFLSYFFVTDSKTSPSNRLALRITKNERLRIDVVSEILKYLRYRYELAERALYHHAKMAADTMVGRAIADWIERTSPREVETELLELSDDGVLHAIAKQPNMPIGSELAAAVRNRRLYKELMVAPASLNPHRAELVARWGKSRPTVRAELEQTIATLAGVEQAHHVLLSIPDEDMRMKSADVLVSVGSQVMRLRKWDDMHGRRAKEIYDAHEALWAMRVFVHPSIMRLENRRTQERIEAAVAARMPDVRWSARGDSGADPLMEQARTELVQDADLPPSAERALEEIAMRTETGRPDTIDGLKGRLREAYEAQGDGSDGTPDLFKGRE